MLDYLNRQLTKKEKSKVIRYMKQYNNMAAIIESRTLEAQPNITSSIRSDSVQESNGFSSSTESSAMKLLEADDVLITKRKLDTIYHRARPIHKLIWDEHFIDGRMDADIYYGNDITKRTYYREKNELISVVAECLGIGTK